MLKVGVLKNESIIFNSVERHLMKKYFFWIVNSVNSSRWKKISASQGCKFRQKILSESEAKAKSSKKSRAKAKGFKKSGAKAKILKCS